MTSPARTDSVADAECDDYSYNDYDTWGDVPEAPMKVLNATSIGLNVFSDAVDDDEAAAAEDLLCQFEAGDAWEGEDQRWGSSSW